MVDPRIDPGPGDSVCVGRGDSGDDRVVVDVKDGVVFFRLLPSGSLGNLTLERWREWAKESRQFVAKARGEA